jgi:CubicO group peptidase (beta-lactamase class C family)
MKRRTFLQCGLATMIGSPLLAALRQERLDEAAEILAKATASGQVAAAVLHVTQGEKTFTRSFGKAQNEHAMFLLGSISKPICVTALMTLFDRGAFKLDDPLQKFIPKFTGDGREKVTMRHLLTHVSGLPDQLPENDSLRKKHAPLSEFAEHAIHTPLSFAPGSKYQYSSMAILLSARVIEIISGADVLAFIERVVFQPLGMKRSAQGLGQFAIGDMVSMQTDKAAPESGGGDKSAKDWDWNSPYWRKLGAPWGGTHCSAPDIGRWLAEFLYERGAVVKPETARMMVTNQNPAGMTSRGLGFVVGATLGGKGCSERTFGHTGSTGTIAWSDPVSKTTCVVLTSLPARAVQPHPRDLVSASVAAAAAAAP